MTGITELPCEVIGGILSNLGSIRSLRSAVLASRHFYSSFKESSGIGAQIVKQQAPSDLLPLRVAVLEASRLSKPCDLESGCSLLDKLYNEPDALVRGLQTSPLPDLEFLQRKHAVVDDFVADFATVAWARLSKYRGLLDQLQSHASAQDNVWAVEAMAEQLDDIAGPHPAVSLSASERLRFTQAFYRVELFHQLFSHRLEEETPISAMNRHFFWRHSLWGNTQIVCVYNYLRERLAECTYDTVSHDVVFGEYGIHYGLSPDEHLWSNLWLSQGLEFLHRLVTSSNYDTQIDMLNEAMTSPSVDLPMALDAIYGDDVESETANGVDVGNDARGGREHLLSLRLDKNCRAHPGCDRDEWGPKVWEVILEEMPPEHWFYTPSEIWLHRRAYVLWDRSRLQENGLDKVVLHVARFNPLSPNPDVTSEQMEEMYRTFDARSEVRQKGGKGYWSENSLNRIIYPSSS